MKSKYFIALGLALVILFMAAAPALAGTTQAQPAALNFYSCWDSPLTCAIYGVSYVANEILGLVVSLGGVLIVVGLAIDNAVVQSPAVQQGFGVTLSLANLGFILGIIVIAIATILRSQTYGIKQSLWKLVVMAILVNFGLVITAPIIGFANNLTAYFVQGIGGGTTVTGIGSFGTYTNQFATTLTNAMAPQNLFTQPPANGGTASTACGALSVGIGPIGTWACNSLFGSGATDGSTVFFQALFSMIFGVVFSFFAALAMITLAVLLIVRYVYLAMLLILLPLAWLTWIFPMFKGQWSKWWSSFIKWTFFPPMAIFFIWLSLITAGQNVNNNSSSTTSYLNTTLTGAVPAAGTPGQNSPMSAIMAETGNQGSALQTGIDEIILVGLMLGGLMAASKLSGSAGAVVVSGARAASGAVTGYATRRTKQAGGAALNTPSLRQHASQAQQSSNRLVRYYGRALQGVQTATGTKLVEQKSKDYSNLTPNQLRDRVSTAEGEYGRQAVLKTLLAKDPSKIREYSTAEAKKYFGVDKAEAWTKNGNEKVYKELRRRSGLERSDLGNEIEKLEKDADDAAGRGDTAAFNEADGKLTKKKKEMTELVNKMKEEDPEAVAEVFGDEKDLAERQQKAKEKTGRVPAYLDKESIDGMKDAIVTSFAEGFSSENAGSLLKAIAKKNNLPGFEDHINKMKNAPADSPDRKKFEKMREAFKQNTSLLGWFEKNPAKALVDHRKLFDLNDSDIPDAARPKKKGAAAAGKPPHRPIGFDGPSNAGSPKS
jgi:hypothetical protein